MGNLTDATQFFPALRLAWAERRALAAGGLRRSEIVEAFGLSPAQASADLAALLALHPGCLTYDYAARRYRWTGGKTPVTAVPFPLTEKGFIL